MDIQAIEKAGRRLEQARKHLENLSALENYQAFQEEWYSFLSSAKSVFEITEEGASKSEACASLNRQEFLAVRSVPLVRYFIEARNADEHGILPVTASASGTVAVPIGPPRVGERGYLTQQFSARQTARAMPFGFLGQVVREHKDKKGNVTKTEVFPPPFDVISEMPFETQAYRAATEYLSYVQAYFEKASTWVD